MRIKKNNTHAQRLTYPNGKERNTEFKNTFDNLHFKKQNKGTTSENEHLFERVKHN